MAYADQPKDQSPTSYMDRMRKLLSPGTKRKLVHNGHKTFGVPLEELVRRAPSSEKVPRIVSQLCDYIQNNGIEQEGIFRVSGSARVVEKLKSSFDQTGEANLSEDDDIMAVAGLLKLFLRELPESVVPEHMTKHIIAIEQGFDSRNSLYFDKITECLNKLPEENYNLLKYLMRFLAIVTQFEPTNKMSPVALAIVFGPNIFRCGFGIEGLKDQGVTNKIVCTFITEYDRLFKDSNEVSPLATKLIKVQGSKIQRTPPPRPPPPKIHAGDTTAAPVAPPRKSKLKYDSSQYQDNGDSSDESHSGMGTPRSRSSNTTLVSPRQSDDESGRVSPFVLDSENGHSIMESPVMPAVASEIVEQTITQAISQYMFGHDGDASTTVSSIEEMTRDSLENETPTPSPRAHKPNVMNSEMQKDKSSDDEDLPLPVKDRVHKFQQHGDQALPETSLSNATTQPNRPKRQRPTSDAFEYFENQGILIGSKGAGHSESKDSSKDYIVTNLSDGVSTNSSLHLLFSNPSSSSLPNKSFPSEDVRNIKSDVLPEKLEQDETDHFPHTLESFKRIPGPKNRRSPSRKVRKSLNLDELDADINDLLGDTAETMEQEKIGRNHHQHHNSSHPHHHDPHHHHNGHSDHQHHRHRLEPGQSQRQERNGSHNNNNSRSPSISPDSMKKPTVPPLDFTKLHEQVDGKDPVPAEKGRADGYPQTTVIPLDDSSDEEVQSSGDRFAMTGVVLSPRTGIKFKKKRDIPWNPDIPPSPPVEQGHYLKHSGGPAEEDVAAATKQIHRRIQFLKKKVKQFEDSFQKENGCKPSHADKAANAEVKKTLVEIAKAKKEIKKLKEDVGNRSRHSSGKSDEGSQDSGGSTSSMEKTLEALLKRLKEKRMDASRPEDVTLMSRDQIQEEKLAVQKALLNFESLHGRPASRQEKDLMRPLYDRYRTIKRMLTKPMSPREAELQTVPEDLPFELQPSTGHTGPKWDVRIPTGDDEDEDTGEEYGTSEFMVTRDMGLLRDTIRPITIERRDSPKVKRKVLEETSDSGENIMGESNLHELSTVELQNELQKARQDKKRLRKVLKEFEDDFFHQSGRKAQKEDREPFFQEYFEYKQIKARLRLLEALLSKYTPSSAV
ncbi:protein FAM13A-like isoform X2 [Liolophura sinensis]|uniref:protein FAM13A-like isoform X2 n=1 Tax=Liolophura sinensis TaxID=3198878 RepID=UPI003157F4AB